MSPRNIIENVTSSSLQLYIHVFHVREFVHILKTSSCVLSIATKCCHSCLCILLWNTVFVMFRWVCYAFGMKMIFFCIWHNKSVCLFCTCCSEIIFLSAFDIWKLIVFLHRESCCFSSTPFSACLNFLLHIDS